MATIADANVTYTFNYRRKLGDSVSLFNITMTFGNSALTYATGGIVLKSASMGCPNVIQSVDIVDQGTSGYNFNYNLTTNKLQLFTSNAHNHALWIGSSTGTAGTLAVDASAALGVFSSVGSLSVAGITAGSGTVGGIVTATPALSLSELANTTAIASVSLTVEVLGW